MNSSSQHRSGHPAEVRVFWLDEEMAELSLLLPGWQAAAMEWLANSRGLTLGQLTRLLIRDYLTSQETPEVTDNSPTGNL
jgi:hypothetical protein